MRSTSTSFQPYDRATGTELSHQQQADCGYYYTVIKAYIDDVESRTETPIPWTRKKLRCSTAELLDAIESLGDEIRQRQRADNPGNNAAGGMHTGAEWDGEDDTARETGVSSRSAQMYQQAVNLLHELVSRLMDVDEGSTTYRTSAALEWPYTSRASFAPGSTSNSSPVSSAFSNAPASRTSYITSASATTGSSMASDEMSQATGAPQEASDESEGAPLDSHHSLDESSEKAPATQGNGRDKATNEWVLEYLRGGWLASSPANTIESTISPAASLAEDASPVGSFRRFQRTASDEVSTNGQDSAPQSLKGSFQSAKMARRSRPIHTVTSRLKGKVGYEPLHDSTMRTSTRSGPDYFKTPRSILSGATVFWTPNAGLEYLHSTVQTSSTSAWNKYLRQKGLIPDPFDEMDWSGRGQHAEFDATEESEIPLTLERALGYSSNALVESVRCRRIRLARKTVQVSRRLKKEEAMKEVEHLQRLKHSHVLRVVGTYTLPRKLSILLYPVADYTLDAFLETTQDELPTEDRAARLYSISTFLRCLAKAVAYIHENAIKHMDIKPKNLLIRDMHTSIICNQGQYKIYLADFGIARSYRSVDECNTESPTAYTKTYAAPEVMAQERRDQKADIFSLGAVYAEMLAVLANEVDPIIPNLDALHNIRENDPTNRSYAAHAPAIQKWLRRLSVSTYGFESDADHSHITELVARMLSVDPTKRPTASTIVNNIPFLAFCCDVNGGSEPFEAADRPAERQLYDRAFEISEADLRHFRCMVDGCVKVYGSREKLEYHTVNGHGENAKSVPLSESAAYAPALEQSNLDAEDVHSTEEQLEAEAQTFKTDWSTF